ncbi:hypothetical protein C0J52_04491 [Blattella germanica]|nr:hypothetical protein C0J52_04491 [Blattella germanica]
MLYEVFCIKLLFHFVSNSVLSLLKNVVQIDRLFHKPFSPPLQSEQTPLSQHTSDVSFFPRKDNILISIVHCCSCVCSWRHFHVNIKVCQ